MSIVGGRTLAVTQQEAVTIQTTTVNALSCTGSQTRLVDRRLMYQWAQVPPALVPLGRASFQPLDLLRVALPIDRNASAIEAGATRLAA